jgi:hypothetical protein
MLASARPPTGPQITFSSIWLFTLGGFHIQRLDTTTRYSNWYEAITNLAHDYASVCTSSDRSAYSSKFRFPIRTNLVYHGREISKVNAKCGCTAHQ